MSPLLELDYLITSGKLDKAEELRVQYNATHKRQIEGNLWVWYNRRASAWRRGKLMEMAPYIGYQEWRRVHDSLHIAMSSGTVVVPWGVMRRVIECPNGLVVPDFWGSFSLITVDGWLKLAWVHVNIATFRGEVPIQSARIRQWEWRVTNPEG